MSATILLLALVLQLAEPEKIVTDAEKKAFLELLATLPIKGHSYTDEAIKKAAPHTRVLLALTKKDMGERDIYAFMALSSGLMQQKEPRQYAIRNFATIAHPTIKLLWASELFNEAPEIHTFVCRALESKEDTQFLAEILGPTFEDFTARVKEADETWKRTKLELVREHSAGAFPEYRDGFSYTNEQCAFAPGRLLYVVRPLKQRGELCICSLADGKTRRLAIPQPDGFKPKYDFHEYFADPVLSVNSSGDLLCLWTIDGNGDHALALLMKGSDSFRVTRVKMYLADCRFVPGADGVWYLIQWSSAANFTVYQVDKDLNLTGLGNYKGRGWHSTRILDSRLISTDLLHLFWADVTPGGNHLRLRCVDFDVKNRNWLHGREIFKLDRFVSSASRPTLLQLRDGSIHYFWVVVEGPNKSESSGLFYESEANGKTVRISSGDNGYRAIVAGDRIVACYTQKGMPEKVFFRVLQNGRVGPISELKAAKGQKHSLWSEHMLFYSESDRLWFVNTMNVNTVYELKIVDRK